MEKKKLRDNFYKLLLHSLGNRDTKEVFAAKIAGKNLEMQDSDFLREVFGYADTLLSDFEVAGEADALEIKRIKNNPNLTKEDKKYILLLYKNASKMIARRFARDYAYQLIFSNLFNAENDEMLKEEMGADKRLFDADIEYINLTYENVTEHREELEEMIAKYAIGYTLDRIYKPDMAVLLYAAGEMKYNENVPDKVAINEAVSIAKKYCTEKSGKFVNGILSSIYKELN